jgi:hypothetical protein
MDILCAAVPTPSRRPAPDPASRWDPHTALLPAFLRWTLAAHPSCPRRPARCRNLLPTHTVAWPPPLRPGSPRCAEGCTPLLLALAARACLRKIRPVGMWKRKGAGCLNGSGGGGVESVWVGVRLTELLGWLGVESHSTSKV